MKAKFFSTKFFFGVVVVFAVICLFVVFFGVVRANASVVSRPSTVAVRDMLAMHSLVNSENAVAVNHCIVDDDHVTSVVYSDMHEQINVLDMHEHLAAVADIVTDEHVAVATNGVMNGVREV